MSIKRLRKSKAYALSGGERRHLRAGTGGVRTVEKTISTAEGPTRLAVRQGDLVRLTVKGDELGSLPLMDQVEPIDRESPAIFELLADTPRRLPDRRWSTRKRESGRSSSAARASRLRGAPPARRARAGTRPLPSHHGHVTGCGVPPRPEITLPVPRQAVQRCGSWGRPAVLTAAAG